MTAQTSIPCILMRGGTSKGPYYNLSNLPEDPAGLVKVALVTRGGGAALEVVSGGVVRTARKLMAGEVFVPAHIWQRRPLHASTA